MGSANLIYLAKPNCRLVTKEKLLNARTSCGENKVWLERAIPGQKCVATTRRHRLVPKYLHHFSYLQVIKNLLAGRAMIVRLDISSDSSDQSSDFGRWSRPALFKEFLTSSAVSCRGFLMSCHFLSM